MILRGTAIKLTRELAGLKLQVMLGDPLLKLETKAGWARTIDEHATPLFGVTSDEPVESAKEESLEDYYQRIIKSHRGE